MVICPGDILTGGIPTSQVTDAPISFSGLATLNIGLFDKDSSPTSIASKPSPETKPIINLMPVPEFPRSTSPSDEVNGSTLFLMFTSVPSMAMEEPILFNAFAVDIGSSPFKKPVILISAFKRDPIITAL